MKKNLLLILALVGTLGIASPLTVFASNGNQKLTVSDSISQSAFEEMINEIETIKSENPGLSEDEILELMDNRHSSSLEERGIIDIWNALTDSEKTLCIRYPFDALKVNTARNIATEQTERKFGCNGLGDRSDACGVRGCTTSGRYVRILDLREGNEESSEEITGCKASVYAEFDDCPRVGKFVKLLDFRHFERHMMFSQSDRKTYKKAISDGVNVSVVLDVGCGNT